MTRYDTRTDYQEQMSVAQWTPHSETCQDKQKTGALHLKLGRLSKVSSMSGSCYATEPAAIKHDEGHTIPPSLLHH